MLIIPFITGSGPPCMCILGTCGLRFFWGRKSSGQTTLFNTRDATTYYQTNIPCILATNPGYCMEIPMKRLYYTYSSSGPLAFLIKLFFVNRSSNLETKMKIVISYIRNPWTLEMYGTSTIIHVRGRRGRCFSPLKLTKPGERG